MSAKALYEKAANLHAQAVAIRDEYDGKPMPAEKLNEFNSLLDQADACIAQAKSMEREEALAEALNAPANTKSLFGNGNQPATGAEVERKAAVEKYLRGGFFALNDAERKALSLGDPAEGGYLVSPTYMDELIEDEKKVSAVRSIARVLPPVASGSVITPTAVELSDAEWTTELGTGSDDTVKPFGQKPLKANPLAKRVKVSNALLRAAKNAEAWVREQLAYKFGVAEENGFINGDGADKALGLLSATAGIEAIVTAGAGAISGDDIINWVYGLPASYARNARILCNRSFIRKTRLLKNAVSGDYIWQPGLQAGSPATILDVPYVESDMYPTGLTADAFDANAVVATIGDFSWYWIVDALGMTVQHLNELYAETNQIGFIGRKEVDGRPVQPKAFRNLKIKA